MATAKTYLHKLPGGGYVVIDKSYMPGTTYYVDSTHASASDTPGFGKTPDEPLATIDFAVGRCVPNVGDMILVMPEHVESLGAAETIDFDVVGITVIGHGTGGDRPRVDYDATDAGVDVGANDIHIENLTFRPSINNTAIGIDIEAGVTGTVLETCETLHGETAATDEFLIHVDIKAGCHGTKIQNCVFRADDGSAPAVGVKLTGASHRVEIRNNTFMGPFSTAAINGITTLSEDVLIDGNVMKVKDGEPGIELYTGTTGVISRNQIASTGVTGDSAIVADACDWIDNYVSTADGGTWAAVGAIKETGTVFSITKTVTKTGIVSGGLALTGASSGLLQILDCILQNDGTEVDSGGNAEVIEFYTNNTKGSGSFMTIDPSVLANEMRDLRDSTTGFSVTLESGKIVYIKATTEDVTSAGTVDIQIIFRRLADGATISAA